jgi:hypothetical protein
VLDEGFLGTIDFPVEFFEKTRLVIRLVKSLCVLVPPSSEFEAEMVRDLSPECRFDTCDRIEEQGPELVIEGIQRDDILEFSSITKSLFCSFPYLERKRIPAQAIVADGIQKRFGARRIADNKAAAFESLDLIAYCQRRLILFLHGV